MVTASEFTITLERVFQGPMDLLLHLVREQEVEIHEVELSKVISAYLAYLEALRDLDIELAGDFLVMASTLMSIKSRSLLPREEIDLAEELDPRDELIQRLLEYRRFKETSDTLAAREAERARLHGRGGFPELAAGTREPTLDLGTISRWDLLGTFSRLMRETLADRPHHVAGEARPLRFYVESLARAARAAGPTGLRELLLRMSAEPTRENLVGSFCAVLELIKLGVVSATQGGPREEILLEFLVDVDADLDHLLDAARFEDEGLAEKGADESTSRDDPGS
ncbi:MAG: hypothetical protein CMJ84_05080 [Planctomycetes bacterium]|nr:hypothetical protein [Planctomycetota bacterium]MDP6408107.1 segregation/condensation protein A [Planctomycetota bacterium]